MMKQSSGFSKYAVAFSGEAIHNSTEIEGPEQLVQFMVQNKKVKKTVKSQKPTQSTPAPKESNPPHSQVKHPRKTGDNDRKNEGNIKHDYSADPKTVSHYDETYQHQKNTRPVRSRGGQRGNRNDRGARTNNDDGHPAHRQFDRHSGMTKSSVKPASRVHGRDDNNWKDEILDPNDNRVDDDSNVERSGRNDRGQRTSVRTSNNRNGGARRGRGDRSFGRGRQDSQMNATSNNERQFKPRNGPGNNNGLAQNKSKSIETPANFVFDDNDFPSFDQ